MSILTQNRILQKGDEYQDNGSWKAVPKEEFGTQVMFTKLKTKQFRRPSEKDPKPKTVTVVDHTDNRGTKDHPVEITISPDLAVAPDLKQVGQDGRKPDAVRKKHDPEIPQLGASPLIKGADKGAAKPISPVKEIVNPAKAEKSLMAEKEKTPAPTPSGAGESPDYRVVDIDKVVETMVTLAEAKRAGLPTVVSTKAHKIKATYDHTGVAPFPKAKPLLPLGKGVVAAATEEYPLPNNHIDVRWGKIKGGSAADKPIWTGRNGTFTGYGVGMVKLGENIMVQPIGKRGVGNCIIEFPISVIPQVIDWLEKQKITK